MRGSSSSSSMPSSLPKRLLDVGEVTVGGQLHRRNPIGQRPHGFQHGALEGEDVLHVPIERGGHADEAHGFGGGRAVEHDDVVALLAPELVDPHHGAELFHAGQDGQFLGFHVADAGGAQHGNHVGGNFAPVPLDLLLDVDFVDGQLVGDGVRVAGLLMEQAGFEVEGIGQAVRGVHAHDEGAIAEARQLHAGGRSQAGLADAAFAAEQQDAHAAYCSISPVKRLRCAQNGHWGRTCPSG
jgi:hypothetical protein